MTQHNEEEESVTLEYLAASGAGTMQDMDTEKLKALIVESLIEILAPPKLKQDVDTLEVEEHPHKRGES